MKKGLLISSIRCWGKALRCGGKVSLAMWAAWGMLCAGGGVANGAKQWFVTPNGDAANDGTKWTTAVRLWDAIERATAGDVINIKEGVYKEEANPPAGRTSYLITKELTLRGGLMGKGDTDLDKGAAPSTLFSPLGNRVMSVSGCTGLHLRDLVFTGGNAEGEPDRLFNAQNTLFRRLGGGIAIAGSTVTMVNVQFINNTGGTGGDAMGGGLWANASTVSFSGTTIVKNNVAAKTKGGGNGGGMCFLNADVSFAGEILFQDNIASDAEAAWASVSGGYGGGLYFATETGGVWPSFAGLTFMLFERNIAASGAGDYGGEGGGMHLSVGASPSDMVIPKSAHAVFRNNKAALTVRGRGGAVFLKGATVGTPTTYSLQGVTIESNSGVADADATATGYGGGLYLRHAELVLEGGSVVLNNVASMGKGDARGGGIFVAGQEGLFMAAKVSLKDAAVRNNYGSYNTLAQMAIYHGGGIYSEAGTGSVLLPTDTLARVYDNFPSSRQASYCGEYNIYPDLTRTVELDGQVTQRYSLSIATAVGALSLTSKGGRFDYPLGGQMRFLLTSRSDEEMIPAPAAFPIVPRRKQETGDFSAADTLRPASNGSTLPALYLFPMPSEDVFLPFHYKPRWHFVTDDRVRYTPAALTADPLGYEIDAEKEQLFTLELLPPYDQADSKILFRVLGTVIDSIAPYKRQGGLHYYRYAYSDPSKARDWEVFPRLEYFEAILPPGGDNAQHFFVGAGGVCAFVTSSPTESPPTFFRLLLEDFHTLVEPTTTPQAPFQYAFSFTVPEVKATGLASGTLLKTRFIYSPNDIWRLRLFDFPTGFSPHTLGKGALKPGDYYYAAGGATTVQPLTVVASSVSPPVLTVNTLPIDAVSTSTNLYNYNIPVTGDVDVFVNVQGMHGVFLPELPNAEAPTLYYTGESVYRNGIYRVPHNGLVSFSVIQTQGGIPKEVVPPKIQVKRESAIIPGTVSLELLPNGEPLPNSSGAAHGYTKTVTGDMIFSMGMDGYLLQFPTLPEGAFYENGNTEMNSRIYPKGLYTDSFTITTSQLLQYVMPTVSLTVENAAGNTGTLTLLGQELTANGCKYHYKIEASASASVTVVFESEVIRLPLRQELQLYGGGITYADYNEAGGTHYYSKDSPYKFSFELSYEGLPSDVGARIIFTESVTGNWYLITPTPKAGDPTGNIFVVTLPEIVGGTFTITTASYVIRLPEASDLAFGVSYAPYSPLQGGEIHYAPGRGFNGTLILDMWYAFAGLVPTVRINGGEPLPYTEVISGLSFNYEIVEQVGDMEVSITMPPYWTVTLVSEGMPEGLSFAPERPAGVYYCADRNSFAFTVLSDGEEDATSIPSIVSTGKTPVYVPEESGPGVYRYRINNITGNISLRVNGRLSGRLTLPQLPAGLDYAQDGDGLAAGAHIYHPNSNVTDSFALLIDEHYRSVTPLVTISHGSVQLQRTAENLAVYQVITDFTAGYDVFLSIAWPPCYTVELPELPIGLFYTDGLSAGTWFYEHQGTFSVGVALSPGYETLGCSLTYGSSTITGRKEAGTTYYDLSGQDFNGLIFELEFRQLLLSETLPTGMAWAQGTAPNGSALLTGGKHIFSPTGEKTVYFGLLVNEAEVSSWPIVKIGGEMLEALNTTPEGNGLTRYIYVYSLPDERDSKVVRVSRAIYQIVLPDLSALAGKLEYAGAQQAGVYPWPAGQAPFYFDLLIKDAYAEADLVVKVGDKHLTPMPLGLGKYRFAIDEDDHVSVSIVLSYSTVRLSPPPTGVTYVGNRNNNYPAYHRVTGWKDSFSIQVAAEYAHVTPLVKTSANTTISPREPVVGNLYTYVFGGDGDMDLIVTLPYKVVTFPQLPEALEYLAPTTAGQFNLPANASFSFSVRIRDNFPISPPVVMAGQVALVDVDTNPNDRIFSYSAYLAETDLTLQIRTDFRTLTYLPIDPELQSFIAYDETVRIPGIYYFPAGADIADTFAIVRTSARPELTAIKASIQGGHGTVTPLPDRTDVFAIVSEKSSGEKNVKLQVVIDSIVVSLPPLQEGMIYDVPSSSTAADYPRQAGEYRMLPLTEFFFTIRATNSYTSLVPEVRVSGMKLTPIGRPDNRYEYHFTATANVTPEISITSVNCILPPLPTGFSYGAQGKKAGVYPHQAEKIFRDTFYLMVSADFLSIPCTVTATTASGETTTLTPETKDKRYIVFGDGTQDITVSFSAPHHTVALPSLEAFPTLTYAEGSPDNTSLYRVAPGTSFSFTIKREEGEQALPTVTIPEVEVKRSVVGDGLFRFTFVLPQTMEPSFICTPVVSLQTGFTLTLPVLPGGLSYAEGSFGEGSHTFPHDSVISFTLQTAEGLALFTPEVVLLDGTTLSPTLLSPGVYHFVCGQNADVTVSEVKLDFFTVIIHTPDVGITVLPEAGTYHKHTDQTFSFSVTPP
ncbi:MAG: hypothetical protein LBB27_04580, partial [Tannerellaceae bacterium]|nr:hypothetical protein [Tannerellaceae bacterium]